MTKPIIQKLDFRPLIGLSSKHLQMFLATFLPSGKPPPSTQWIVDIGDGDRLSCEVSTPADWKTNGRTFAMIHGLGGNQDSKYMIRMARKFFLRGDKVIRMNFRNCGTGEGLSSLPYCAANSYDFLKVIQALKEETPQSSITLIGFSLGGNAALKLAGEIGGSGRQLLDSLIAVCPPLDLKDTVEHILQKNLWIYHQYYLQSLLLQAKPWVRQKIHSLYEFDDKIIAPLWGFKNADDYYFQSSSKRFLDSITCPTHLIFAHDDPFISFDFLNQSLPPNINLWASEKGGHMGFLGQTNIPWDFRWLDQLLLHLTN